MGKPPIILRRRRISTVTHAQKGHLSQGGEDGEWAEGRAAWTEFRQRTWSALMRHRVTPLRGQAMTGRARAKRCRPVAEAVLLCLREGYTESALVPHDLTLRVMGGLDQALIQTRGRILP